MNEFVTTVLIWSGVLVWFGILLTLLLLLAERRAWRS